MTSQAWIRQAVAGMGQGIAGITLAAGMGLAAAPAQATEGYLIYRVYLPTGGAGKVTLPTLNFAYTDGRPTRVIKPCTVPLGLTPLGLAHAVAGLPTCAWTLTSGGPLPAVGANVAYPDTSAVYWVTPFTQDPALRITIKGQFPDARYMSVNVYDASLSSFERNGVKSGLADFHFVPDAGSLNPWQTMAPAGGHFTLDVRADAAPGMVNTLPMPDGGSVSGALPPPCSTNCPPTNVFQPAKLGGLFPNVDNAYIAALIAPQDGQVYVMRGRLPQTVPASSSTHPVVWPAAGSQLRYWSMCSNVYAYPYPVTSCLPDTSMVVDAQGYYTIVASSTVDRPSNATAAQGVNWLQNAQRPGATRQMLIVRNMLPNGFAQSVQGIGTVPEGVEPADWTAQQMGDYDPRISVCSKQVFEAGGWQACVQ